jgi:RNA polymerase sigma-70 factor (ECF subfamily)
MTQKALAETAAVAPSLAPGWLESPAGNGEMWPESGRGRGRGLTEEQVRSLVSRARAGDDGAFEALVRDYQSRIYNHVSRMVQDPYEAEDVAQETFVRAYQALPRFRGEASFQTWLYRIATNLAIDASRRRQRLQWQSVSLDEPLDDEESPRARDCTDSDSRTPGEVLASSALRAHVWSAIAELSDKLRPVVILYDLQGLSYNEIALLIGSPLGTVKSRLFNARCQLRDKLRERLPEDFLADLMVPMQSSVFGATAV